MASFNPRSMKQKLADSRLAIDRGPTVGQDEAARDPLTSRPSPSDMTPRIKSPTFKGRAPSFSRGAGRPSF